MVDKQRIGSLISDALFAIAAFGLMFEWKFWYISAPAAIGVVLGWMLLHFSPWIVGTVHGLLFAPIVFLVLSMAVSCLGNKEPDDVAYGKEGSDATFDPLALEEDLNRIQGGGVL